MNKKVTAAAFALGVLALAATVIPLRAQESQDAVDPEAVELLRGTMDYLGELESFSEFVFNLREDLLDSGQRIDVESAGGVTVVRPNKLRGVRHAGAVDEVLVYDGERLTLYNDAEETFHDRGSPLDDRGDVPVPRSC